MTSRQTDNAVVCKSPQGEPRSLLDTAEDDLRRFSFGPWE